MRDSRSSVDVLVIGGGQAGLVAGYHLRNRGLSFRILERNPRIGDSWRNRYDSLVLFTPRSYSALPEMPLPGDPEGYPSKDEIADYLEAYARHFELPVSLGDGVRRLERQNGGFLATTDGGATILSRAIVLANGPYQRPAIPPQSKLLSAKVVQLSPESYKRPSQVPKGTVLIVGDGATGRQIASELAETHRAYLAAGSPRKVLPDRVLGHSIFWWLTTLRIASASRESRLGRRLMKSESFPGKAYELDRLRARGVSVVGRLTLASQGTVSFASGESIGVDAVIWATGYREDAEWIAIPEAKDARGELVNRRGVSPVAGLYLVGRKWQWTMFSDRICGAGADAAYVVDQLTRRLAAGQVALRAAA